MLAAFADFKVIASRGFLCLDFFTGGGVFGVSLEDRSSGELGRLLWWLWLLLFAFKLSKLLAAAAEADLTMERSVEVEDMSINFSLSPNSEDGI